jgi:acetyl-CoA C-acetyltransferase
MVSANIRFKNLTLPPLIMIRGLLNCLYEVEKLDIVIAEAVRTPIGKFLGAFSNTPAQRLGGIVIRELVKRSRIDYKDVDEVIMGNVIQAGVGQNPARQAAIIGGFPYSINAYTVNKVCGSSLKAVMLAAQSIKAGDNSIVIAGGMENMSMAPYILWGLRTANNKLGELNTAEVKGLTAEELLQAKFFDSMIYDGLLNCECYGKERALHMGTLAEAWKGKYNISEDEINQFAYQSHMKAVKAIKEGKFKKEIVPVNTGVKLVETDESPRPDTTPEKIAQLKKVFKENGVLTAGNSSQISDGASAVLVADYKKAKELGLKTKVRIIGYSSYHHEPEEYGTAPVYAIEKLLNKTKTKLRDYGLIEINEAFSVQVLAVRKLLLEKYNDDIIDRLNVNGGAIALGHPIGASGARILTTLIHVMEDRNVDKGLASLCLGGGGAVALAVEKI